MNEITIFEHPEFGKVRAAELDDQIYFCGPETASAVNNSTTRKTSNSPCKGVAKRDGVTEMMTPLQANEISVFNQSEVLGKTVSVYGTPEAPLFLARDVAEWIEYNPDDINKLVGIVDDDEKLTRTIFRSGQNRAMWFLTEDGLYEVLMQSRKPKAKIFKAEVKKILKTIRRHGAYLTPAKLEEALLNPDVLIRLATNLKAEQEKSARLEARIQADSSKVRFAEAVTASSATIRIGELAKILKQNGYPTGQTRLFAQLRAEGYLMKNAVGENIPTQKAMELGLFEIQESAIVTGTGKEFITKTTRVTGKGQQYFIDRYTPEGGRS